MVEGAKAEALDYLADRARRHAGYRLICQVKGYDPITRRTQESSGQEVLDTVLELLPQGEELGKALRENGALERSAQWLTERVQEVAGIATSFGKAVDEFLEGIGWKSLLSPLELYRRADRLVDEPLARIKAFASNVWDGVLALLREAVLVPLGGLAKESRGWGFLCALLGKDPLTGEKVPSGPLELVGGLLVLMGEEEIWSNIRQARAVERCMSWFAVASGELKGFVLEYPRRFVEFFQSLELRDLALPHRVFEKMGEVFGGFLDRFLSWGANAMWTFLEIVFDAVSPGAWATVKRTGAALRAILRDPVPFMENLLAAAKGGFDGFADRFPEHLQQGLLSWLTGSLTGVYLPKSFAIPELFRMALSVLGISLEGLRERVAQALGEPAMKALETGGSIVATFLRDGPLVAWDEIKGHLADLKDEVIGGVVRMVVEAVAKRAVPKIVAFFVPGAGFVAAIVTIWDAVQVFRQKLERLSRLASEFGQSVARIAAGDVAGASAKVESVLAGLLDVTIGFVMGFLGLGRVADQIREVVESVRGKLKAAIDAAVAWVVKQAKGLLAKGKAAVGRLFEWWNRRKPVKTASGESHTVYCKKGSYDRRLTIESTPTPYRDYIRQVVIKAKGKVADADRKKLFGLADQTDASVDHLTALAQKVPPASEAERVRAQDSYEKSLDAVAAATAAFLGKATAGSISTPARYGPLRNGYGTSVEVALLTRHHPKGEESTKAPPFHRWKTLAKRKAGHSEYYVRGHLLNNNLGGSADWVNLTPITQVVNNRSILSMLNQFEAKVKAHVESTDRKVERTVKDFRVEAKYGQSFSIDPEASEIVRQIQAEELLLPKAIDCKATLLTDGTPEPELKIRIPQDLDTVTGHYFLSKRNRELIEIGDPKPGAFKRLLAEESHQERKMKALKAVSGQSSKENRQKAFFAHKALGEALWLRLSNSTKFRVRF